MLIAFGLAIPRVFTRHQLILKYPKGIKWCSLRMIIHGVCSCHNNSRSETDMCDGYFAYPL